MSAFTTTLAARYDSAMKTMSIGIDEVGRGPVAGPVTVCAFAAVDVERVLEHAPAPLRDSKQLTALQRAKWMEHLRVAQSKGLCTFAVASVSAQGIDTYGISASITSALTKALAQLAGDPATVTVFLDGSLRAPQEYVRQTTIIKGDSLIPIISLASIVAKETRDAVMKKLGKQFPEYGFERHVGYGTKAHYAAIAKYGTTPHHRISFLRKYVDR